MLKHSLVTITAKDGAQVPIPHIGGRTPQNRIEVPQHVAKSIAEQGLDVEVHVADYVKEDVHAAAVEAGARQTKAAKKAAEGAASDDRNPTSAVDLPAQAAEPEHDAHSPTAEPLPTVVADGEPPAPEPERPAAPGEGSAGLSPTRTPATVANGGAEAPEHSEAEETLDGLRAKVEALKTIADAQALVKEYGIDLGENPPATLKGIKQAVLEMVDATAEEQAKAE